MTTAPGPDPVLENSERLAIVALLAPVTQAGSALVRDQLGVTDAELAVHTSALDAAGYVRLRVREPGEHERLSLSLTDTGRIALDAHLALLDRIAAHR
jgi:hypothetical protein